MNVIIPLAGLGRRMRPHTWSRPKPLLYVAGNTVIGHLLNRMAALEADQYVFVIGYKGAEIEAWIRQNFPQLPARFVVQEEALGQAHAIWLCRDTLDQGEALIAFGDGIVEADYPAISQTDADAILMVQKVSDPRKFGVAALDDEGYMTALIEKPSTDEHRQAAAGIYWFRHGRQLRQALDRVIAEDRRTRGEYYIADAYEVMLRQGVRIKTKPVTYWFDAGNPENILETNARLLGLGYGSEDAIERSYVEDFTVVPPIFLHETAEIEQAVVGPYATIGPGASVRWAVIRNSIIDQGASVEGAILDGALVGERSRVTGRGRAMFVGDDSNVELN